jgi:UDP-glucose 4-epimerase
MLSPDFRRLLRYGRAVDLTRLVKEVGFRPRFTTEAAVADYLRARREAAPTTSGDRANEPPAA